MWYGISAGTLALQRTRSCRTEKKAPADCNTAYAEHVTGCVSSGIDVEIRTEADEFWSYVGDKSNQRWTWYVIERQTGIILAHQNGKRTDAVCQQLLKKLQVFPIRSYSTDQWQSYAKYLPPSQHHVGKDQTWKIERTNLNFRTHLKRLHRKTICFSKDATLHDTVIGLYIEHHYYKKFSYSKT